MLYYMYMSTKEMPRTTPELLDTHITERRGLMGTLKTLAEKHRKFFAILIAASMPEVFDPDIGTSSEHNPKIEMVSSEGNEIQMSTGEIPFVETRIPGDRIQQDGSVQFLWSGRQAKKADMQAGEEQLVQQQIDQLINSALQQQGMDSVNPSSIFKNVQVTIHAHASPEGWRQPLINKKISEERAKVVHTLVKQTLVDRGIDINAIDIHAEGDGAEGDLFEFSVRIHTDLGHTFHGDTLEAQKDEVERILEAVHDGDMNRVYQLLPEARGHEDQVNTIYRDTVADHRRVDMHIQAETKDIVLRTGIHVAKDLQDMSDAGTIIVEEKQMEVATPIAIPYEINPGEPDPMNMKQRPIPPTYKKKKNKIEDMKDGMSEFKKQLQDTFQISLQGKTNAAHNIEIEELCRAISENDLPQVYRYIPSARGREELLWKLYRETILRQKDDTPDSAPPTSTKFVNILTNPPPITNGIPPPPIRIKTWAEIRLPNIPPAVQKYVNRRKRPATKRIGSGVGYRDMSG